MKSNENMKERETLIASRKRCMNHGLYTHEPHVWTLEGESWYCPGSGVEADLQERLHIYETAWRRRYRG